MQQFWIDLLYVLLGIVIGAVIGFFAARKVMKKYIKEYITVFLIFIITAWLGIFQPFYALDHMASDMVYQRASAINKKIKIF